MCPVAPGSTWTWSPVGCSATENQLLATLAAPSALDPSFQARAQNWHILWTNLTVCRDIYTSLSHAGARLPFPNIIPEAQAQGRRTPPLAPETHSSQDIPSAPWRMTFRSAVTWHPIPVLSHCQGHLLLLQHSRPLSTACTSHLCQCVPRTPHQGHPQEHQSTIPPERRPQGRWQQHPSAQPWRYLPPPAWGC